MRDLTWLMTSCLEVIFKLYSRQTTATTPPQLNRTSVPAINSNSDFECIFL